ncbi:MAG: sialidase family protein, partial [Chloroflexota bacterium]|nr:sialidase family protein [Chloroflexota bacterium]
MAPRIEIVAGGVISRSAKHGAFMPVITPLADGTLIAAQHVGESLGSSDNHIEVLRSADGGRTWVNQGGIHPRNPPRDGYTYRGPHIHTVPDGRLAMTAGRFEASDDDLFDADTESLQRPAMLLF